MSDGIACYVAQKNAYGIRFETGRNYLTSLTRFLGDRELNSVTVDRVMAYLDHSKAESHTWHMKYAVFARFFEFWATRGEMAYLIFPPPKPKVRCQFVPYIYSRSDLRALLRATDTGRKSHITIDDVTMRTLLLFLYATGALLGEALGLQIEDVNLKDRTVTIRSWVATRTRRIPICDDLCDILHRYLLWRSKRTLHSPHLFVTKGDRSLYSESVEKKFCRIRKIANVSREASATYQPRLHDLKCTFAVHRITSWIRGGADLNRMLPALAAYLGQRLGSTERYFLLTPERFTKQLKKLSPQGHRGHWRNDKKLMEFLASL
jgi:site-specific recombinase XerD